MNKKLNKMMNLKLYKKMDHLNLYKKISIKNKKINSLLQYKIIFKNPYKMILKISQSQSNRLVKKLINKTNSMKKIRIILKIKKI